MINLKIILITAGLIVIVNSFGRFVLKMASKKSAQKIAKKLGLKKILRIHELFLGIVIALISYLFSNSLFLNLGLGLALSDFIYHIILKIATGNSQFYINPLVSVKE